MQQREIIVDSRGEANATWIGVYVEYEGLEVLMVADPRGEVSESPIVDLDKAEFPLGVVICPQKEGVILMDPALPTTKERALRQKNSYYMDLVGRIMEITTGQYVTGRRDTFGFHLSILERYAADRMRQTSPGQAV